MKKAALLFAALASTQAFAGPVLTLPFGLPTPLPAMSFPALPVPAIPGLPGGLLPPTLPEAPRIDNSGTLFVTFYGRGVSVSASPTVTVNTVFLPRLPGLP